MLGAGQEQVADRRDQQMPPHRLILAALEVIQPQLPFLILEAPFDMPPPERHLEQLF